MGQPSDSFAHNEFESLSEVIASNLDPEHILSVLAQRIKEVLAVSRVRITLRQGKHLLKMAGAPEEKAPVQPEMPPVSEDLERWVAAHGRPVVIEQGRVHPAGHAFASALDRSAQPAFPANLNMAFVPIWSGRQIIGVLSILDEPSAAALQPLEAPMGSGDGVATSVEVLTSLHSLLPLLTVLSDLISLALDNRRLLVQSDRRAQLLGLLTYLASNLSAQSLPELTRPW